ncbi:MAG: ATP-dependent Clp protease proteolytic subunit [Bacillota bacterium]|nr:ATP-dependent Clp protease proteolytic subunit [Bacillota bacterium]MDW7730199.1 ATP-dependent Clp protease proteolytic subunit [Bacillota bacterium]
MENLSQFFWIFIIITALTPYLQQQILRAGRTRKMAELERKRGSRVITLIHRQEAVNLLGVPLTRFINIEDSEQVLTAIRLTCKDCPIDLIIHTPGGLVLASEQIAEALLRHSGKVTVFVPHYAMSGGTLIAMAADELVMDQNAVLGPLDPQLGQYPATSILKVLDRKPIKEVDDQTIILADVAAKALSQVRITVRNLLKKHMDDEAADKTADLLTQGTWTHDYPIDVDQIASMGINVNTDMPAEIYSLMSMYPQPRTSRPSVEYNPGPVYPTSPKD